MPSLPDGTPDTPAPAAAPIIDPDAFERFEGWRETTLAIFTEPTANATPRAFAEFIYTVCLEYSHYWPPERGKLPSPVPRGCRRSPAPARLSRHVGPGPGGRLSDGG
jgi:hypothetical protein